MTKSRGILATRYTWTPVRLELLRGLYASTPTADLAELLGCTVQQCYSQAGRDGLLKGPEFKASSASGRVLKGGRLSIETQFKPGIVPWNKGAHYVAGGRSAETRFKPGQMCGAAQRNYVPVGSYRVNGDGYLDRKVRDDGLPQQRWVAVHRLVWIEANGQIPEGHVIVFRARQRTTVLEEITVDRLECITRAELAQRNRMPGELQQIAQLRGAITRQINKRLKEKCT